MNSKLLSATLSCTTSMVTTFESEKIIQMKASNYFISSDAAYCALQGGYNNFFLKLQSITIQQMKAQLFP